MAQAKRGWQRQHAQLLCGIGLVCAADPSALLLSATAACAAPRLLFRFRQAIARCQTRPLGNLGIPIFSADCSAEGSVVRPTQCAWIRHPRCQGKFPGQAATSVLRAFPRVPWTPSQALPCVRSLRTIHARLLTRSCADCGCWHAQIELYGPEGTGKSSLALHAIVSTILPQRFHGVDLGGCQVRGLRTCPACSACTLRPAGCQR